MKSAGKTKSVLDVALAMLSRREHAVAELRQKLRQKGYGPDEIDSTLVSLQEKNYLNDARYAENRARTRAQSSKWGASRIAQELTQHGVNKTLTSSTLEELGETHDWLNAAHKLLQRKFAQPLSLSASLDDALGRAEMFKEYQKEKARRISFLTRRGFSLSQALQALDLVAEGEV